MTDAIPPSLLSLFRMKNTYYIQNNFIHFQSDYNKDFVSAIKALENSHYNPELKEWYVERNLLNRNEIGNIISKFNFSAVTLAKKTKKESGGKFIKQKIKVPKKFSSKLKKIPFKLTPKKYQVKGIYYMTKNKKVINGDDVGLGKTGQSICSVEVKKGFPCIVIPPAALKFQWQEEWEKWIDGRNVSVIDGRDKDFDADVVVINYDILNKYMSELEAMDAVTIIADEAHKCKNSKALRTKAVKRLARNTEYTYLLTGTLIKNRPSEIIAQIEILGLFEFLFGNFMKFVYRYCNARKTQRGLDTKGASKTLELNELLRENCYIRRERAQVKTELPGCQEIPLKFSISNKTEYRKAETDLIKYLRENVGELEADNAKRAEAIVKITTLRKLTSKGKIKGTIEMIDDLLESLDDKICVFGVYTETLEALADHYNAPLIYGGTNSKKKTKIKNAFIEGNDRVIFGNIESMGTGTDGLQHVSSTEIIVDLPDNPSDIDQIKGRLDREGQKRMVNAYLLISPKTIDKRISNILKEKKIVTDAVNKGIEVKSFGKSFYGQLLRGYL